MPTASARRSGASPVVSRPGMPIRSCPSTEARFRARSMRPHGSASARTTFGQPINWSRLSRTSGCHREASATRRLGCDCHFPRRRAHRGRRYSLSRARHVIPGRGTAALEWDDALARGRGAPALPYGPLDDHGRREADQAGAVSDREPDAHARHQSLELGRGRARFEEGLEAVRRLLEEEQVTFEGAFHRFKDVTSLPRPTQTPRPPFWVAALGTPESFEKAGKAGHNVMAIPLAGGNMKELIGFYRQGRRAGGHAGKGRVMLAFHMFCHEDAARARDVARERLNRYLETLVSAASEWASGMSSKDYPGYDRIFAGIAKESFETQTAKGAAWVGTPDQISEQIADVQELSGGFEIASMQVNFSNIAYEDALGSMALFSEKVMPHFTGT